MLQRFIIVYFAHIRISRMEPLNSSIAMSLKLSLASWLMHIFLSNSGVMRLLMSLPDSSFFKLFGCSCYPFLIPYNSHKLNFRSHIYLFLSCTTNQKGCVCLHLMGKYVSRNVIFNENDFLYKHASNLLNNNISSLL